jgi:hypothetical protein
MIHEDYLIYVAILLGVGVLWIALKILKKVLLALLLTAVLMTIAVFVYFRLI